MANVTQICNAALGHFGLGSILDITEPSTEAENCNLFYSSTLDELLREHPWSFATKTVTLTQSSDAAPGDWLFRYAAPVDYVRAINLVTDNMSRVSTALEYRTELAPSGDHKSILADVNPVSLRFVSNDVNTNLFPPDFRAAFEWRLGGKLVLAIIKKNDLARQGFDTSAVHLLAAKASDRNESQEYQHPIPRSVLARRGLA